MTDRPNWVKVLRKCDSGRKRSHQYDTPVKSVSMPLPIPVAI